MTETWPQGNWSITIKSYDEQADAYVVSHQGICTDNARHAGIAANVTHKTLILSYLGMHPYLDPHLN